ncbi:T9SS type A sorting domain-containing protein [Psychroserpens jangbogonensis]|uniref:T9SS type A sorting domain-containing protein n=1 Tax=Psychroserpens jangbogonensis TaxID=1484460 RepID=UPI00053F05E3|nr:T9SS type A sorting domain-containing protein [Psychroserpens jangbogonensis]
MKKITLLAFFIGLTAFAQQISVSSTSSIVIGAGASLNAFGLEMSPSVDYEIADNEINLSSSLVYVSGGKESILRVYEMANPLASYSGSLILNYEDAEINSGTEMLLNIEIEDNSTWTEYASTVNDVLNTITLDANLSSVAIDRVTASASDATLQIDEFELDKFAIYPNPATSEIRISSDNDLQFEIYNSLGQKIKESNLKNIDISTFSNGIYLLKVIDIESNKSNTYKIIKK